MEETRCPVCKEELNLFSPKNDVAFCAACGTPHHLACWRYAEKCSAFACGSRTFSTVPEVVDKTLIVEGSPLVGQLKASLFILMLMAGAIWGGLSAEIWYFLTYIAFHLGIWGSTFPLFLLTVICFSFFSFSALLSIKYRYLIDGEREVIDRAITVFGYRLWTSKGWLTSKDIGSVRFSSADTIFGTREAKVQLQTTQGQRKELVVHTAPSTLSEGHTKTLAWQTAQALHRPFAVDDEPKRLEPNEEKERDIIAEACKSPTPATFSVKTPGNVMRNVLSSLFFSLFYGGFCWLAMTSALGLSGPPLPWAFAMAILFVFLAFTAAWTRRFSYSMTISLDAGQRKLIPRLQVYGLPLPSLFYEKLKLDEISEVWHLRLRDHSGNLERLAVRLKSGLWRFLAASSPIDPSGDDLERAALDLARIAQVPAFMSETPALFVAFRPFYKSEMVGNEMEVDTSFLDGEENEVGKERDETSGPLCALCQMDVASGLVATCRSCGSIHHLRCWRDEGACSDCGRAFALVGPRKRSWLPAQVGCADLPWFGWSKNLLLGSSLFVAFGLYLSWAVSPLLLLPTVLLTFGAQTPLTLVDENIVDGKTGTIGKRSYFFGYLLGPLRTNVIDLKRVSEVEQLEDITLAGQVVKSVVLVMDDGQRRRIGFGASAPCRANEWLAEFVAQAAKTTVHRLRSDKFLQKEQNLPPPAEQKKLT